MWLHAGSVIHKAGYTVCVYTRDHTVCISKHVIIMCTQSHMYMTDVCKCAVRLIKYMHFLIFLKLRFFCVNVSPLLIKIYF